MKTPFLKTMLSLLAVLFFITSYAGGDPAACPGANHRDRISDKSYKRNRGDYYCQRKQSKSKGKHHHGAKHYYH